ncbi:MAG TPA: threonine ammonia-lyase [Dissulfurispiraceae bacterium]|nr:threonine ammonia-lyase [Dissulfurispiraceae bacterium]
MEALTFSYIKKTHNRLSPYIHKTPLVHSNSLSEMFGAAIYLKAENLQKTGSFKVRGAFSKLSSLTPETKIVAASMGNHAQGVAFAARSLGMKATIVMPCQASLVKQEAAKGYGAKVILHGESLMDALNYARSLEQYEFIHPFDDDAVIAGQGTIGIEVLNDLRDADTVLVPVGGGGLIAGMVLAIKSLAPGAEVIGVQTVSASSAYESFRAGKPSLVQTQPTLADGIAVGMVGARTFEMIKKYVDDVIKVTEESIARAVLLCLERKKLVVEGAGAVPLAAIIEQKERFRNRKVVLVLSGGNIDFATIDRIINKGLISSGRIGVFKVMLDDLPGRLHRLTGVISGQGGNILNVTHDRLVQDIPFGKTLVMLALETRGFEHITEINTAIREAGFTLYGS